MDLQEARQQVQRLSRSNVQDGDYFPLVGGLNTVETPLQLQPGELIGVLNYEPKTLGGYQRLQGYERFDGRTAPSQAPYYLLNFASGVPANYPVVGDTVNGQTSGATALVLLASVLGMPNTTGTLILWTLTGNFTNGENLRVGATVFAIASGTQAQNAAATDVLNTTYALAATTAQRALIQVVPGSGPILGVVEYNHVVYAFRNNIGGTAAVMYQATSSGWVAVPGFPVLNFVLGTSQINAGDTITGATSGNTATVRRVVLASGSWAAGTATGYLILAAGSPAFNASEILNDSAVASATTNGSATTPTLAPNGVYDFRVNNFYGSIGTIRLYGVDGANKAFEFQDSPMFFCQISSGMATDTPIRLESHRGRLWLAFRGGSVQPSGINDAVVYSALQGAAELGVGYEITGMLGEMSPSQSAFYSTATLFIFTANQTFTITGDGPNWILGPYAVDTGANAFTVQRLGQGIFLCDRGFATLQAIQQLGNFAMATISQQIQNRIAQFVLNAVCSMISRSKSLYRLFQNDGTYVAIGFKNTKSNGITVCSLGQAMSCAWSGESAQQQELLMMGGANGYVYQMDSGVNIDGAQLVAFLRTAFHFSKTPARQKRYRRAQLDVAPQGPCTLSFAPDYSFGDPTVQPDTARTVTLSGGGGYWDVALWDQFKWDNAGSVAPSFKLEGSGLNIGIVISHSSTNEPPHTIQGVTLHKSQRRLDRSSLT